MKIALFSDSFLPIVDGVGRVVVKYASALSARGHEVYVICPQADSGYRGGLGYEIVDYVSSSLPQTPQYKAGVPFLDTNFRLRMDMLDFDIIHAHSPGTTGLAAVTQTLHRKIPLVGTFHSKYYDDILKVTHMDALATIGARYVAEFYRHCSEVWTVSHNAEDTLRSYGYKGSVHIMPNGTDFFTPSDAEAAAARETFHLPDCPLLLYVGQINLKKNLKRVLDAFALTLQKDGENAALVLAGQGPDMDTLKHHARALGISDRVIFTGMISDPVLLRGLYRAADLFVFPSLYDTAGLVVLEAAMMETPSVVASGSAPAEIVHDGENGYLCDNTDESLAAVLHRALHDPARVSLGLHARATLPRRWDDIIDHAVDRYEELIEDYQMRKNALL